MRPRKISLVLACVRAYVQKQKQELEAADEAVS